MAVVLHCIDSRSPAELIFDASVGDLFSVRIAGNITSRKILGSVEYGCAVAGARLILVMGHTRCGAVAAAVNLTGTDEALALNTGCQHIGHVVRDIQKSIDPMDRPGWEQRSASEKQDLIDEVARRNVIRVVETLLEQSRTLKELAIDGRIAVVGAMYDVVTGLIEFLPGEPEALVSPSFPGTDPGTGRPGTASTFPSGRLFGLASQD